MSKAAAPAEGHLVGRSGAGGRVDAAGARGSRLTWSLRYVNGDVNIVTIDPDPVNGDRFCGWRRRWLAGTHVEARSVHPALHRVVVDLALGQRYVGVRAQVTQREHFAAGSDQADRLAVDLKAKRATGGDLRQRAGLDE